MIIYTIHSNITDIPVWTSSYKHDIIIYLDGLDLNSYYIKYTDNVGNTIKCSAKDFLDLK